MSKPFINVLKIVGVGALCALTFCFGRYDLTMLKHGYLFSYKDFSECILEEATIYSDIINDIYEIDGTYFENIIETDSNYIKLIDHYNKWEGKADWDWESMYNL